MTDHCPALAVLRGAMGIHDEGPEKGQQVEPRHRFTEPYPRDDIPTDTCGHCGATREEDR